MGAIQPQMGPLDVGGYFEFGYNTGYNTGPFDAASIAPLVEAQGYSYNTQSFKVSGTLSYYISITGNSNVYWSEASDLANAILQILQSNGYSVDVNSIQFRAQTAGTASALGGTPYPNPNLPPGAPPPPGQCSFSTQGFGQWIACEMGLKDPITGALLGSAGTAIGIGVVALVALILIKK